MKKARDLLIIILIVGIILGVVGYTCHTSMVNYYEKQTEKSLKNLEDRETAIRKYSKGMELNEKDTRVLMDLMGMDYSSEIDRAEFEDDKQYSKEYTNLTDSEIAIKKWENGKNLLVGDTKIIMEILGLKYGNSADMKTFRELEEKQIEKMQK